jgi:hypothetical protein
MHNDKLATGRIFNDWKKTFITQSSIDEHIEISWHKDIVKMSSGIIKNEKQNEL